MMLRLADAEIVIHVFPPVSYPRRLRINRPRLRHASLGPDTLRSGRDLCMLGHLIWKHVGIDRTIYPRRTAGNFWHPTPSILFRS